MTTNTVAETIRQQIGGKAFYMMGASDITATDRGLWFRIRGCRKYTHISIKLAADDTYTVNFSKVGRAQSEADYDGVYADGLHQLIEQVTGLYLSLGTMGK